MRRPTIAVAAAAAIALIGGSAGAAPTVTITSPEDAATVSRSETPSLSIEGTAAFDTPAPTTRSIYLRYDGSGTSCGHPYLSDVNGPDPGNSCSNLLQSLSVTPGEDDFTESWPAEEVAFPLTIDASRNLAGTIYLRSNFNEPTWAIVDVEVILGSTAIRQRFDDGLPQTNSHRSYNLNIDIPASLDKVDVNFVQVNVHFQSVVGLIWVEFDSPASFIDVPAYTASFNRKVETRVGTSGSWTAATLDEELTGWSATLPTPAAGNYFLQARAVQGGKAGAVAQNVLHVTP